jgi:predicted secreted protein
MAATYQKGSTISVMLATGRMIVCKQTSTISFTNSPIEVRNSCTGDYAVKLEGGQKSGSISITGDYDKTPTGTNVSAFDLADELGGISTAIWGGSTVGDEIVTVPVQINSVEITGDLDTAITFSATLDFAGTPLFGVVTT